MEMAPGAAEAQYNEKKMANCDQEAVIQGRIMTAMLMAIDLKKNMKVRADEHLWVYGLHGIAEGCAREIIEELGMRPEFVNIRPIFPPHHNGPIPEYMLKHFCEQKKDD